jgi:hypothetical protein
MVLKFFSRDRLEEGNKKVHHILCCGWIHFQPDQAGMGSKGKYDPISEMFIESYKNPVFIDSLPENLSVIAPRLADFRCAHHVEPSGLQRPGYVNFKI